MGSAVGVPAPGTQPSAGSFSSGIIFRKLLKATTQKATQNITKPQRKANSTAQLDVQGYHCRSMFIHSLIVSIFLSQ